MSAPIPSFGNLLRNSVLGNSLGNLWLGHFLKSRLSRRIILWIFLSIVVIEAILLIPSVYRREQELLNHLKEISAAEASGIVRPEELAMADPQQLLNQLKALMENPVVQGGALYQANGELVGTFGMPPQLQGNRATAQQEIKLLDRRQDQYDAVWSMSPLEGRYVLIIHHNTERVEAELYAFVGRITGLVVIISLFVTLAMMIVLDRTLIGPIVTLRQDLLKAGNIGSQAWEGEIEPDFASLRVDRRDELGDVIAAFGQMFQQIYSAIAQHRQSEARFRAVVEQAVDAFFIADATGQFTDVNQQACTSLGYSRTELLQLSVPDVQQKLSPQDYAQMWQRLRPGQPITVDGTHRRKDGSLFPVEVRLGMVQPSGQPSGQPLGQQLILALARDVTERKEAEKALKRLAEIGELAAMIVHEVRNPLTTVLMGLDSFNRMALPERAKMRLALAMEESERLQRLLNEILLYAKQQKLHWLEFDLNLFMTDLWQRLQGMPMAQDRTLDFASTCDLAWVRADRDKLKQVLINLVSNACEAIAPGERVRWQLHQDSHAHQYHITVQNGGEPIPPDLLPKLTQPFYTTKSSGNGLGLAITQRIVEAHGGTLTIESDPTHGTTVTVLLPNNLS
jgi:PAS domain S-box-containing protein